VPTAIPEPEPTATPRPRPTAVPEAVGEGFWVQVLASTSPDTVAKAQASLEKQGFTADRQLVVREPDGQGNELLKLRVGPFPDHASADRVARRMQGSGFSGAWVVAP
jgi:cell division septation protein DedD